MKRLPIFVLAGMTAAFVACDTGDDAELVEDTAVPAQEGAALEEGVIEETDREPAQLLNDAMATLNEMQSDAELGMLLQNARGVFIVPSYGKAAVGVGARGGEGVLLARQDGGWSNPVFYDIGAVSVGPQFGATGGEIAMILVSEQTLNAFHGENTFSLNADAGFTLVDYSARAQGTVGKGDVILWSDMEGAFAGVSLSASDISYDEEENRSYYGAEVTAERILSGEVTPRPGAATPMPQTQPQQPTPQGGN